MSDLFAGVADFGALCEAARRAAKNKRMTAETAAFLFELEPEVLQLQRELLEGSYRPRTYRTFTVPDPKPRTISAAAFRDRVVHHALCAVLEPIFERYAIIDSYACRVGKGSEAAVLRAQRFARRHRYVLKLDVRKFFETVDHAALKALLDRRVRDPRVLDLASRFIDAGAPGSPPGKGLPIGNLTSQHFANFYLSALDHLVKDRLRVKGYLRYMDDLLLFGDDKSAIWGWRNTVDAFLSDDLHLALKEEATLLVPTAEGLPFLGFRIWPNLIRLDAFRVRRFRAGMRELEVAIDTGAQTEDDATRSAASRIGWASLANTRRFLASFQIRRAQSRTEGTERQRARTG